MSSENADELTAALHAKSVANVCPACGRPGIAGTTEMGDLVGGYCAHCGHVRLFHRETLEAPD